MCRGCPCHLAGRSLRPSWPPLSRCWLRFAILASLASNAGSRARAAPRRTLDPVFHIQGAGGGGGRRALKISLAAGASAERDCAKYSREGGLCRPRRLAHPQTADGSSGVKIQAELIRMRTEPHRVDLPLPLPFQPRGDHVVGEHVAAEQEAAVTFERVAGLVERGGGLGHVLQFLGRHVVDVAVERFARVELVLDAVDRRQ